MSRTIRRPIGLALAKAPRRALSLIAAAATLLLVTIPKPAVAATNGEIAFTAHTPQDVWKIGTINPDGSGARLPIEGGTSAAWSPDGRKLAFMSTGGPRHQHVMIQSGGNTFDTNVPAEGFDIFSGASMAWSPDGTRLAYSYHEQIWVMTASPPFTGTRLIPADCFGAEPTWSPDSTKVAYQGWYCMDPGLYIINSDGTGNTRLPDPPGVFEVDSPDWSPDGTQFAFLGGGGGMTGLWAMDSDGTDPRFLVATFEFCCGPPDWSPDGTQIAFIGNDGLSTVNADGTGLTVLRSGVYQPRWRVEPSSG